MLKKQYFCNNTKLNIHIDFIKKIAMSKKILILPILLSVFFSSTFGQKMRFGIITSPAISWFNTDVTRIEGDGSKFGFNIGLMVDKYFAEHYAITSGLTIRSIGGILKYKEEKTLESSSENFVLPPNSRVQYNLQYLHVPWGLKFKTTEIGYATFYAELGLDAMINIKARATVKDSDISQVGVNKEINMFYMGYHFAGGMEYNLVGNTSLMVGISYMNGFTDITQKSDERTLMHAFELRLGIIF
jgi:hypothetical protein